MLKLSWRDDARHNYGSSRTRAVQENGGKWFTSDRNKDQRIPPANSANRGEVGCPAATMSRAYVLKKRPRQVKPNHARLAPARVGTQYAKRDLSASRSKASEGARTCRGSRVPEVNRNRQTACRAASNTGEDPTTGAPTSVSQAVPSSDSTCVVRVKAQKFVVTGSPSAATDKPRTKPNE